MEHGKNPFPMDHWAQQSPIKLFKAESTYVEFPQSFLSIDYSGAPFDGEFCGEPGHRNFVLSKLRPGQRPPLVTLGSVQAELVKIHVHTPSEHELEGDPSDGEIHLIHEIKNPTAGSELVVFGVLFDEKKVGVKSDFFKMWATQLKAAKRTARSDAATVSIDPRQLLPTTTKWYHYEGSLTSEPYNEFVSWLVFPDTLGITSDDLKKLKREAHQPERETQGVNRRFVLRNFR